MAEKDFEPSCWRYVKLNDIVADMSVEEREKHPWTKQDGEIIVGKIVMSKAGCQLIQMPLNTRRPIN